MSEVSIIIPVYNVETFLERCLESVLKQSFEDFEIIIVDDGSTDNSLVICNKYMSISDKIILIRKENGGLSSARNAGLDYVFKNSNSSYISFLDSDDWIDEDFLILSLLLIKKYLTDVVILGVKEVYKFNANNSKKELDITNNYIFEGKDFVDVYYSKNIFFTAWGKLYRKSSLQNISFKVGATHEDEYFANEFYSRDIKCLYNPEEMYFYYKSNKASIMNNLSYEHYWYAADSLIERFKLVKCGKFSINSISLKKLIDSLSLYGYEYCNNYKTKKQARHLSYEIARLLPFSKHYIRRKVIFYLMHLKFLF